MMLPSRKTLAANAFSFLLLAWLYGGDLLDAWRSRDAEVAAFLEIPPRGWPATVLALATAALAVALWGMARKRSEDFKGYRLLPILLVCALFADLVLAENHSPMTSDDMALLSLQQFEEKAQTLAQRQSVPVEPSALQPFVEALGQPPYLVRGVRPQAFSLQVRRGCEGPVREAPGAQVGTLLYCVSGERTEAWVTLVGLPLGKRFGMPAVVSSNGEPQAVLVRTLTQEDEEGLEAAIPFLESEDSEAPPPGPQTVTPEASPAPEALPTPENPPAPESLPAAAH